MRILILAVAACGGGSGNGGLDCEYLAGPDNCWATTASAAVSCLPADGDIGVLAADNGTCSYASGQVITFENPLELPLPNDFDWAFDVTKNGQACLHYQDSSGGFRLTVGADTVSESLFGQAGLELTCPDGEVLSNGNALDLLNCPGASFGNLPGNTTSSSTDSVTFGLLNAGADVLAVFDCQH